MVLAVTAASGFGSGGLPITGIQGVVFNGTNNSMVRGADLTGAADSTGLTYSGWVKMNSDGSVIRAFVSTPHMAIRRQANNLISVHAYNTAYGAYVQQSASTATLTVSDGWTHILVAINTNFSAGNKLLYLYKDGVDITGSVTDAQAAFTMDLTASNWGFFNTDAGNDQFMDADVAEVLFENTYVDITSSSERLKFRTSGGKPADVGADGSTPFGTQPLVYLSCKSASAADIATNLGTGGGMTLGGSVARSATSPAD